MSTRENYHAGEFNFVDLMSHGLDGAKAFYGDLFGWTAEDQDTGEAPPYVLFHQADRAVAGLGEASADMKAHGVPPVWNTYVAVDDVAATVARVAELGGTVVMPAMPVAHAGHMAICLDGEGAAFSLWQAGEHIGAEIVNEPGAWCWNELYTHDFRKAEAFYGALFGWTFSEATGVTSDYHVILRQGREIGGLFLMRPDMAQMPPAWMPYFAVADLDASLAKVWALKGAAHTEAMTVPAGRFVVVNDAQGAVFTLIELSDAG